MVRKSLAKPDATGAVASVQYGATSRSELMGRAAGPVYNFKGRGNSGGAAAVGKLGADMKNKVKDLQRQLETAGLPPEARAKLQMDIDAALKGVNESETAPQ